MKKNFAQLHFPACKVRATLLQTGLETTAELFQSGVSVFSPACSSVDDFQNTPGRVKSCLDWFEGRGGQ
jgi:UDP-N-acetylmuramoylalanine-D-glutamate ligase